VWIDHFLITTDNPSSVGNSNPEIPEDYLLAQNYPNPFNPTTAISFSVPTATNIELKVFDVLGREVATLVNEPLAPGSHTVKFDAGRLASGVYHYRLRAGDFVETKKMILMK
jgi:hypothetical protein